MLRRRKTRSPLGRVLTIINVIETMALLFCLICLMVIRLSLIMASDANHGIRQNSVINNLREESVEYGALFHYGLKVFETAGDEISVGIPNRMFVAAKYSTILPSGGLVYVHNHPGYDLSFSLQDLISNYEMQVDEQIVVTEEHIYSLKAPQGWPSEAELMAYFEKEWNMDISHASAAELLEMKERGLVEITHVYAEDLRIGCGFTSALVQDIADYFGMEYTVEEVSKSE